MKYLAVDFGTSSTLAAYLEGKVLKFATFEGESSTPTVLYFPKKPRTGQREYLIGNAAIREYHEEEDGRLLFSIKSLLGDLSFGTTLVPGFGPLSAAALCGLFLAKVKALAEEQFKQKFGGIVLGRPANFSTAAIADLRKAARLAGFSRVVLVPEPVAAGMKHFSASTAANETIFIFDAGGGTTDFAVLHRDENRGKANILGTGGLSVAGNALSAAISYNHLSPHLGRNATWGDKKFPIPGHYFVALKDWRQLQFLKGERMGEVFTNCTEPVEFGRFVKLVSQNLGWALYEAVNAAKIELSQHTDTTINLTELERDLSIPLSLAEFNRYAWQSLREMQQEAERTLKGSGVARGDISTVVLTGGTSYVPAVQNLAKELFPHSTLVLADPFSSVAGGLALVANRLNSKKAKQQ